jgi:cyclic lactone autoinducer peptide
VEVELTEGGEIMKRLVYKTATFLSMIALFTVSVDSFLFVHQPETPEELL